MTATQRPAHVPLAPPPWWLEGSGYIVQVRLPEDVLAHGSFIAPGLVRAGRGRVATLMFVDYAKSDVGPYHELLYIPGKLRIGPYRLRSITRIFVSSWASVINGERNWGIPKDCARFDVRYGEDGVDRIAVSTRDGEPFARLTLSARGPTLPAPAHWVPRRLRTLAQLHDGRIYRYAPSASGRLRFARVRDWWFDARHFPDLARGEPLFAVQLPRFRMQFPVARITPLR
ncbi:acetoacetate decarboxylase family protein [Solimonas soli]|uniref:acetoacetate decarboxylase family protein n=1 Tax=Solimonas soli TaxID=413479 RepID=UPI0009FDD7E4|nr:acetoacetate decarboxylase family protein [Solimonas soli]